MTIKEAAKKLHVEAHVLRYWEDELKLDIKRNAQGHRYYDDRDIRLFESVKAMKEEGLMLKDIRQKKKMRGMRRPSIAQKQHRKKQTTRINHANRKRTSSAHRRWNSVPYIPGWMRIRIRC